MENKISRQPPAGLLQPLPVPHCPWSDIALDFVTGLELELNQELETGLCCLVSKNPSPWSKHLIWVEYAHNTLPCFSSGLSSFQCAYGYQPPLFPEAEMEVGVPLAQALIHHCRRVWSGARHILQRSAARSKRAETPAPTYRPGDQFWLSMQDLPLLQSVLRVHPPFHVSRLKPAKESPLVPASRSLPPPQVIEGDLVYTVKRLLAVQRREQGILVPGGLGR